MPTFTTRVTQAEDMDATGLDVPAKVVESLKAGKRPKVNVTLNGHTYRSTVSVYGGAYMLPLAKVNREAACVKAGQSVKVTLTLDTAPREIDVPKDFAAALKKAGLREAFDAMAFTHRKEHVSAIEGAKAPETRARRIVKALEMVKAKKK